MLTDRIATRHIILLEELEFAALADIENNDGKISGTQDISAWTLALELGSSVRTVISDLASVRLAKAS